MESVSSQRSIGVLIPVVPAQVGVSEAQQVLCNGSVPIARLITVGLGLASMYFFFKFLVKAQVGFDKAGDVPPGRGASKNRMKKNRYKILQTRDALYSLLAGVLPSLMLLVVFPAMNINVIGCLA